MGKMTGWAQKGIGAAGGNKLRGLNKNSNAFLRNTGANMGKNAYSARKRWENSEFGKSRLGRVIGAGRFGKGVAGMISGVSSMSENMKECKAGRDKRDDLARMGRIVNKAENDPQFRAAVGAGRIISMQNKIEDEAINEEMAALSRQTIIDDSGNLRRIQASDMGKLIAGQNLTFADSGGGRTVMSMHGQSGTTKFGDNARMAIRRTVAASGGSTDKENLAASIFSIADEGERADAMDAIYKAGVPWVNGKRIPTMQTGGSGKDRVIPITDAELAQAGSGSGPNRLREIKYEMRRGAMTDGAFDVDQVADYDEGKFKAFMDPFAKFNENGEIETLDTSGLDSKAINNLRNILTSLGSGERATKFSRVQINEQNRLKALNDLNSRS